MSHLHDYISTFISVAEDCPATEASAPPVRPNKVSAANVHHRMIVDEAGQHTQSRILFAAFLNAKGHDPSEHPEGGELWTQFWSKGQPCLRCSALGKRYGWGLHFDAQGRVRAVPVDSPDYARFAADSGLVQKKAMRSKRT
ncbi:MAG: DUF6157 family protein [Myxococcota bacterium]